MDNGELYMYNGIINVYKEKGYTSFDVVARLRGILKQKKIGHTGTLDPDACGVLVVCIGNATKLCDLLTDKDKKYTAVLRLGITTDTEDSSGNILTEKSVNVSENQVREVIMSFIGEYDQIPPMYSAIKVNGKKLYELARQGIEIERTPRRVVINNIDIMDVSLPYVKFSVSCGKGTYIRSLCRDIGEKLSCGGIMDNLVRDSVNISETGMSFNLEDSLRIAEIEEYAAKDCLKDHILTIDKMFPNLKKVMVNASGTRKLMNGNVLYNSDFNIEVLSEDANNDNKYSIPEMIDGREYLVYDDKGSFKAIYRFDGAKKCYNAYKMFL